MAKRLNRPVKVSTAYAGTVGSAVGEDLFHMFQVVHIHVIEDKDIIIKNEVPVQHRAVSYKGKHAEQKEHVAFLINKPEDLIHAANVMHGSKKLEKIRP